MHMEMGYPLGKLKGSLSESSWEEREYRKELEGIHGT